MNPIQILDKLVSFKILGGDPNLSIISWIEEYIHSYGIETRLVYNEEKNKANLHCRIGPSIDGGFILSGHTDVVPVEGQIWDSDPFKLIDKNDGKLYARGSCDMKGFLACCLASLPEMVKMDLKKPIYFAFSFDEEIGCLGAPSLIDDINSFYLEKPKYAIIGEPTNMVPVIGQKGICVLETHVNGSAGHSSRIKQEVSAIHESARLILWLENKMNGLVESGKIDNRFDPPHSSIHIGKVKGGVAPNIIADHCSFTWDVRIIPSDSLEEIIEEFKDLCDQRTLELRQVFSEFEIKTKMFHPAVPTLDTSENSDILKITQELAEIDSWTGVSYAAEAGQFAQGGFESIICGPGSISQAHRANEFIEKTEIEKGMKFIKNLMVRLSK